MGLCALRRHECGVCHIASVGIPVQQDALAVLGKPVFVGFAVNNILLFVDLIVLPRVDLFMWRTVPALVGVMLFIYGLIWEPD
jgi:Family of unknown function (DUF5985)